MNVEIDEIKSILLNEHYVSAEDMTLAEKYAQKNNSDILTYLFKEKILNRSILGQAIAENKKVDFVDLQVKQPNLDLILKIPKEIAQKYNIVVFEEDDKSVKLATSEISKKDEILPEIEPLFFNKEIHLYYAFGDEIENLFFNYRQPLQTRFSEIIKKQDKVASEIIDEVIKDAVSYKASDIHIEPQESEVIIRFRIDGILQEAGRIDKELFESLLNRIKVKAHMRTDEHYTTQDGAIRMSIDNLSIDLRVSIVPILDGEKVVIRILSQYIRHLELDDLGFSPEDKQLIISSSKKPYGMILVTGPTGSGKTTTLYSVLRLLHKPDVNITTIEDPVEYRLPGVNQIQVNVQTDLTFAKGLRSIIRQDPNVILVGEIRDKETAEIAVNASLTGHLLLSTFHANNAATAIPRLFEMGVEPFLLASTLNLVVSQRLLRKACQNCRRSTFVVRDDLKKYMSDPKKYFPQETVTLYQSKGCNVCNGTGYKGRMAIFEMIYITDEMQDLILESPSMGQIWDLAKSQGARSFFDDGIEKVKSGLTTLDELIRVAPSSVDKSKIYGEKN